jgi:hypothetical protein
MDPRLPVPLKPSLVFTGGRRRPASCCCCCCCRTASAGRPYGRRGGGQFHTPTRPHPRTPTPPRPRAGTSLYRMDPASGLVLSHTDAWDAVQDSSFGAPEALLHVARQMAAVQLTPALEGPSFKVLRRAAQYEVRQYQPYVVAVTGMGPGSGGPPAAAAAVRHRVRPPAAPWPGAAGCGRRCLPLCRAPAWSTATWAAHAPRPCVASPTWPRGSLRRHPYRPAQPIPHVLAAQARPAATASTSLLLTSLAATRRG